MTRMARILFTVGAAALLLGGCSKSETTEQPTDEVKDEAQADQAADQAADKADEAPAAAKAAEGGDYIKVYGAHEPTTEADPVEIVIQSYEVTSAQFDPANLEGGAAELSLDLNSIKSNDEKRDGHLKTADYLDTAQFATATVKVSDVKKVDGDTYSAQAEVTAHGVTKSFPVQFDVLETAADSVRIKAEHEFDRLDFEMGQEPDGENERVAKGVRIEMQLTLKPSA